MFFCRWMLLNAMVASTFFWWSASGSLVAQQPKSTLWKSHQQFQKLKQETLFGAQWIPIGPVTNSARVESVQLDPTRPGTMYAAFGSGGLWKTVNNGVTWKSIFNDQVSYGIGDIALAPSDPNVLYVGTGESLKKARNFTIPGAGIYRSNDGGDSWKHLGLEDSWHIGEIAVHPQNPDIVLVAVLGHFWSTNPNRGLYLTTDGGANWKQVLYIDEKTGANDVVWSHSDPDKVYASLWENNPGVAGANSAIYTSTDGGLNWTQCKNGLPSGEQIGRIGLAVSYTNADKVYALIDNREFSESAAAQVYRSLDGGKSWKRTHQKDQKFLSRIGWYFADIYVNPRDDEDIYALGVRLAHSNNGGKTFEFLSGHVSHVNPSSASGLHLDHCEMWIHPKHPEHLVVGNDGGLYQSFDGGLNWQHFNNIPAGEFYDIEIDQSSPLRVFAGAQDDATVFGPPVEFNSNRQVDSWKYLWIDPWNGGDGCVTLVDPSDPNTVYYSAQEGAFRRKDMRTNRSQSIRPRLPREFTKAHPNAKLKFNFVAPMIISPHDSNTLYIGGNYVLKSENRGERWSVLSSDLSSSESKQSVAVSSIAESPRKPGLIYCGTDSGTFWTTDDSGANWIDRSAGLPNAYVRSISPSNFSDTRVYLAMSGLNRDDFNAYLFCSEDAGQNWKNITANLPAEPVNTVIESPHNENLLIAGTFRGVYLSIDRGKSWSILGTNLPTCSISDLAIHKKQNLLIVGTHGRGIFKLDLTPIQFAISQEGILSQKAASLFPIPVAFRPYLSDTRPGLNFRENEKLTISFWLRRAGKARLAVFRNENRSDLAQGDETKGDATKVDETKGEATMPLAEFELVGRQGFNQFRWDLVTRQRQSDNPYFINYKSFLNVGSYQIELTTKDGTKSRRLLKVEDRKTE